MTAEQLTSSLVDMPAGELSMADLLQWCQQVRADNVDALSSLLQQALQQGAQRGVEAHFRQAAVNLVNGFLQAGHYEPCLQLVRTVTAHLDAPELAQVKSDLSRHVAGAHARQVSAAVLAQTDQFMSTVSRPMLAADHGLMADAVVSEAVAIVIQGPVLHDKQFTLETLKLYDRMFPGADLVLSTWEGEDVAAIAQAGLKRLHICQHAKPQIGGPANINFQITSAREGIRFALENLAPTHVLKTRTDMRFGNPNLLLDMLALLDQFPLKAERGQRQRLLLISDVVKYMMYAAPDKNMFGVAADMMAYWDQPLDGRPISNIPSHPTMLGYSQEHPAEIYLLRNYLAKLGWAVQETLADHFDVLRDLFVVFDRAAADLYWHKYAHHLEYRFKQYGHNQILEEFGFNDWLRLQTGRYRLCDAQTLMEADQSKSIVPLLRSHLAQT